MKINKVNYSSALFFGLFSVLSLFLTTVVTYLIMVASKNPVSLTYQELILTPLISGLYMYGFSLLAIFLYNKIAKKYPISWEVKK